MLRSSSFFGPASLLLGSILTLGCSTPGATREDAADVIGGPSPNAPPGPRLMGEEPAIRVDGLKPSTTYTVAALRGHSAASLAAANVLMSQIRVQADASGAIDLRTAAPEGGYAGVEGVDPWGILWSMVRTPKTALPAWAAASPDLLDGITYDTIRLVVLEGDAIVKKTEVSYLQRPTGTVEEVLDPAQSGFVGTLVAPARCKAAPRSCPGLVLWSGSGGIQPLDQAYYYASHGISVVTMLYFTSAEESVKPFLPLFIRELPLEIFKKGIDFLKSRTDLVDPSRIAIAGGSRGGESALLAGQFFSDSIVGVVAHRPWNYAASSSVGSWIDSELKPETSAWSFEGRPVGFLPIGSDAQPLITIGRLATLENPQPAMADGTSVIRHRGAFEAAIRQASPSTLEAARIKVENIKVPIFASATTNDVMWPSDTAIADIEKHRAGKSKDVYILVPDAGHLTNVPGSPTAESMSTTQPISFADTRGPDGKRIGKRSVWLLGGTPKANHEANLTIMRKTIAFLETVYGQALPISER